MLKFHDFIYYISSAFLALLYLILKENGKEAKYFASITVLAIFISLFIVPWVSEHYELSITASSGLSGILVLFGTKIIDTLDKKIPEKINDKIDKL